MGLLDRFWTLVRILDRIKLAFEVCEVILPECLHDTNTLLRPGCATFPGDAQAFKLPTEPANANTKVEASAGQVVEVRHLFCTINRLTLRHQAYPGAKANAARVGSNCRQRHKRVKQACW